nr:hypothetical protein [Tanacetum cinerariifolium]
MVNFRRLENNHNCETSDITIPIVTVEEIAGRFENTLYGYFIGMEDVLESGLWMKRNVLIILKQISLDTSLQNESLTKVPVWVILQNVPMAAFNVDGLSFIATKLGEPKILDVFTSVMCVDSCGRNSFACTLIELDATFKFEDELVVAIPRLNGSVIRLVGKRLKSKFRYEPKGVGNTSKSGNGSGPSTFKDGNKHNTVARNGSDPKTSKDGKASGIHFVSGNTSKPTNGSYRPVMKLMSRIMVSNSFSTLEEDNCNHMDDLVD